MVKFKKFTGYADTENWRHKREVSPGEKEISWGKPALLLLANEKYLMHRMTSILKNMASRRLRFMLTRGKIPWR